MNRAKVGTQLCAVYFTPVRKRTFGWRELGETLLSLCAHVYTDRRCRPSGAATIAATRRRHASRSASASRTRCVMQLQADNSIPLSAVNPMGWMQRSRRPKSILTLQQMCWIYSVST